MSVNIIFYDTELNEIKIEYPCVVVIETDRIPDKITISEYYKRISEILSYLKRKKTQTFILLNYNEQFISLKKRLLDLELVFQSDLLSNIDNDIYIFGEDAKVNIIRTSLILDEFYEEIAEKILNNLKKDEIGETLLNIEKDFKHSIEDLFSQFKSTLFPGIDKNILKTETRYLRNILDINSYLENNSSENAIYPSHFRNPPALNEDFVKNAKIIKDTLDTYFYPSSGDLKNIFRNITSNFEELDSEDEDNIFYDTDLYNTGILSEIENEIENLINILNTNITMRNPLNIFNLFRNSINPKLNELTGLLSRYFDDEINNLTSNENLFFLHTKRDENCLRKFINIFNEVIFIGNLIYNYRRFIIFPINRNLPSLIYKKYNRITYTIDFLFEVSKFLNLYYALLYIKNILKRRINELGKNLEDLKDDSRYSEQTNNLLSELDRFPKCNNIISIDFNIFNVDSKKYKIITEESNSFPQNINDFIARKDIKNKIVLLVKQIKEQISKTKNLKNYDRNFKYYPFIPKYFHYKECFTCAKDMVIVTKASFEQLILNYYRNLSDFEYLVNITSPKIEKLFFHKKFAEFKNYALKDNKKFFIKDFFTITKMEIVDDDINYLFDNGLRNNFIIRSKIKSEIYYINKLIFNFTPEQLKEIFFYKYLNRTEFNNQVSNNAFNIDQLKTLLQFNKHNELFEECIEKLEYENFKILSNNILIKRHTGYTNENFILIQLINMQSQLLNNIFSSKNITNLNLIEPVELNIKFLKNIFKKNKNEIFKLYFNFLILEEKYDSINNIIQDRGFKIDIS